MLIFVGQNCKSLLFLQYFNCWGRRGRKARCKVIAAIYISSDFPLILAVFLVLLDDFRWFRPLKKFSHWMRKNISAAAEEDHRLCLFKLPGTTRMPHNNHTDLKWTPVCCHLASSLPSPSAAPPPFSSAGGVSALSCLILLTANRSSSGLRDGWSGLASCSWGALCCWTVGASKLPSSSAEVVCNSSVCLIKDEKRC